MHSVLNEGSFLDAITAIATSAGEQLQKDRANNKSTYMYGSISKYTQKLILSFPTICDNTIPISTAQMISKAHEKNLVSMFEMLFTSMSLSGTNGIEILKALHQNLNDTSSIDDIIDAIEKAVGEAGIPYSKAELRDIVNEMCYELKYKQKSLPVDSFSEKSLNDYLVRESYSGTVVMEAPQQPTHTKRDVTDAYKRGQQDAENSRDAERAKREKREWEGKDSNKTHERHRQEDKQQRETERKEDYERRSAERADDLARRKEERQQDTEIRLAQSRVRISITRSPMNFSLL